MTDRRGREHEGERKKRGVGMTILHALGQLLGLLGRGLVAILRALFGAAHKHPIMGAIAGGLLLVIILVSRGE